MPVFLGTSHPRTFFFFFFSEKKAKSTRPRLQQEKWKVDLKAELSRAIYVVNIGKGVGEGRTGTVAQIFDSWALTTQIGPA